jgi:hypothetical protein
MKKKRFADRDDAAAVPPLRVSAVRQLRVVLAPRCGLYESRRQRGARQPTAALVLSPPSAPSPLRHCSLFQ